jgi:hypothetical protein
VDYEVAAVPSLGYGLDEAVEKGVAVVLVETESALDGHRELAG